MKYVFPDAEEIKKIHESGSAKYRKRTYIKKGYDKQLSLYGILSNKKEHTANYCRIEILSNTPYTYDITFLIYNFFNQLKPPSPYSIWIYDKKRQSVKCVGRYH